MSNLVDWSKAPEGAEFYAGGRYRRNINTGENHYFWSEEIQRWSEGSAIEELIDCRDFQWPIPVPPALEEKPKTSDASASIANLLNAQSFIAAARKSSEFSEHNLELADQADAILQAIIDNLKAERIPAEASFHLANAQNELSACAKLLEGDKTLADAVFCIGEKLAGIRKGEL